MKIGSIIVGIFFIIIAVCLFFNAGSLYENSPEYADELKGVFSFAFSLGDGNTLTFEEIRAKFNEFIKKIMWRPFKIIDESIGFVDSITLSITCFLTGLCFIYSGTVRDRRVFNKSLLDFFKNMF